MADNDEETGGMAKKEQQEMEKLRSQLQEVQRQVQTLQDHVNWYNGIVDWLKYIIIMIVVVSVMTKNKNNPQRHPARQQPASPQPEFDFGETKSGNSRYHGRLKRNPQQSDWVRDGIGTDILDDQSIRQDGFWKDDMLHGFATVEFQNGNRYEGQMQEGEAHGYGSKQYHNGTTYHGSFVHSERSGYGVLQHANGDRVEGHFDQNRVNDTHARLFFVQNQTEYYGSYFNGTFNGNGTMMWLADGTRFKATWKDGHPVGQGTFLLPRERTISGRQVEDYPHVLSQHQDE